MPALPGFRDFLPSDLSRLHYLFEKFRSSAQSFGFEEYATAPLEPLELYTKKSGPEIVSQLYNFKDKGHREVALRPELTPSLARLAAENHRKYKKPLKWFSIPQLFRYERQQKGRLREHFQFNADIVGSLDISADAELVALLCHTLQSLGLTEHHFLIRISHRCLLPELFQQLDIPLEQQPDVIALIDKIEKIPTENIHSQLREFGLSPEKISELLTFLGRKSLCDLPACNARDQLEKLFNELTSLEVVHFCCLDTRIVRGLAYYTGVVFEAFALSGDGKPTGRAIAGGGRYDDLVKNLTGTDLPATGFGMGDVVLGDLLEQHQLWPVQSQPKKIFFAWKSEATRSDALATAQLIRKQQRFQVEYSLKQLPLAKQLHQASERGAALVVIVHQDAKFEIRDFRSKSISETSQLVTKNDLLYAVNSLLED